MTQRPVEEIAKDLIIDCTHKEFGCCRTCIAKALLSERQAADDRLADACWDTQEDMKAIMKEEMEKAVLEERRLCAEVANRYMADQKDPAKAVAASDIKILIRQRRKGK